MKTLVLAWIMLTAVRTTSIAITDTTYTFAEQDEWTDNFTTQASAAQAVSWQAAGGLDDSGSIDLRSGTVTQGWFSDIFVSGMSLQADDVVEASVYFQFDASGTTTSSIKFGFASNPNAAVNGAGIPQGGSWVYSGAISRSSSPLNIEMETYSSGFDYDDSLIGTFADDQWYLLSVRLTAIDPNADLMDFGYMLYETDAGGNITSTVGGSTYSLSINVGNGLYNGDIHTFVSFENPVATSVFPAMDNLSVPSQIPEPSGAMLLAIAGGLAAWQARRRSS